MVNDVIVNDVMVIIQPNIDVINSLFLLAMLCKTQQATIIIINLVLKGSKSSHSGMRKRFVNNRLLLLFYFVLLTIYF